MVLLVVGDISVDFSLQFYVKIIHQRYSFCHVSNSVAINTRTSVFFGLNSSVSCAPGKLFRGVSALRELAHWITISAKELLLKIVRSYYEPVEIDQLILVPCN